MSSPLEARSVAERTFVSPRKNSSAQRGTVYLNHDRLAGEIWGVWGVYLSRVHLVHDSLISVHLHP